MRELTSEELVHVSGAGNDCYKPEPKDKCKHDNGKHKAKGKDKCKDKPEKCPPEPPACVPEPPTCVV